MTVYDTAALFSRCGLDCAELCFCQTDLSGWKYNFSGYHPFPDPEDIIRAVGTFRSFGISVVSLGIYNCLWQGDAVTVAESLRYFCEYCDAASEAGIGMISTHTGTTDIRISSGRVPANYREKVLECFAYALMETHKRGLTAAIEYGSTDALKDHTEHESLKDFIRNAIGTDSMLKYIGVPCVDKHYHDADDVAMFHLKDKKNNDRFYECFGKGDADFSQFFASPDTFGNIPVILEYVNRSNLYEVSELVKRRMQD